MELAQIEVHVETCLRCQGHLDDLTRVARWQVAQPSCSAIGRPEFNETIDQRFPPRTSETPVVANGTDADPDETLQPDGAENVASHSESRGTKTDHPTIPGYEITQCLGEGGMGVVYEARHLGLKRRVAVKMIRGGAFRRRDHLARLRIEAEVVARLGHPNIVQIFDIGEANGLPFVSLELLEGGRLSDRLNGTPQPGLPSARLVADLALAVDSAHHAGIIHRDLKPSNVMFTLDGTPKITDFGLAKRIDSDDQHTESGQIMGSPSYMAPEQARGHSRAVGTARRHLCAGSDCFTKCSPGVLRSRVRRRWRRSAR